MSEDTIDIVTHEPVTPSSQLNHPEGTKSPALKHTAIDAEKIRDFLLNEAKI